MNLLRPGSHQPLVLTALCITIMGVPWFLERTARTTISDSITQTISPIAQLTPATHIAKHYPSESGQARVREAFGSVPLSFEINRGQTDGQVKFLSHGRGYGLFLTSTEAVLALGTPALAAGSGSPDSDLDELMLKRARHRVSEDRKNYSPVDVVRMRLIGADSAAQITGLNELPGRSNYFVGNDPTKWRTDVAHYQRVEYRNVYDGVDLVYYGNQQQLEYDFVVAPGADPRIIRMAYNGVKAMEIDKQGSLVLKLSNGQLQQERPLVYQIVNQTRKEVSGRFVVSGRAEISFNIGEYDSSKPLIIDPAFVFSTYLGGGTDDVGIGIATDSAGNSYVTGRTVSTNFPTANPYSSSNSGLNDIFVTKLNSTGSAILYSTYIGGSGDDQGFSIAVNSGGQAYLTGSTRSPNFPLLPGSLQPFFGGGFSDGFLVRLNSSGNGLITSTYAGGSGEDAGTGIALDNSGNIYGVGYTDSTDLVTVNPIQPFNAGSFDGFLLKLPPNGDSILFSTYAGGGGDDFGNAIAVDSLGFVYAIGDTFSTNLTTVNALQPANGGGVDAFIAKLTPSGTIVFATYCGGSATDSGTSISVDGSGNIYALGYTNSTNFPPSVSAVQSSKALGYDVFIRKLNPNGTSVLYSTYLGGNSNDFGFDIATDSAGNAYVAGETFSTNFPLMNPLKSFYDGARDVFLTKLGPAGNTILFSTYLGGAGDDDCFAIAADESGNAHLTGRTASSNFLTTNAVQPARQGGYDLFVTKVSTTGAATPPSTPTPTPTPTPGVCSINNGGLNPRASSESGVAAPAGSTWSELQHDAGNLTQANGSVGSAPQQGVFRLADDFAIGQPCTFTSVVFFAYQTGAPATPSPFAGYTLRIHNGRPGDVGSTVVFGDTTTNRLASSVDSNVFRISNSVVPSPGVAPGTTRKIWMNTVNINTTLPAGTYWLDWASTATNAGAHFQPTKTIAAARSAAGDNARQLAVSTGVWTDVLDPGGPGDAPDVPQDFPFVLNGTVTSQWQPVVLTAAQIAEIKSWTVGGRTYIYVKPQFPDAGYRVVNWGQAVRSGNDFTADASVEKFTGPSIQAVVTTAQIYDLGPLANGTYNFNFKTSGTLAKTLQFTVSSIVPPPNPIDDARQFVKQQYRDFLNREADPAGEDFWTDNIAKCADPARRPAGQTEAQCTLRQRETTSGAFFLSPEFQYTGYFVYRMYQGGLGRQPKLSEFLPDAQFVGNGIVVNGQLSGAVINQNKAAFAAQFVNCSDATRYRCAEFKAIYDPLNNQQYVDKLFQTTGVNASASDRTALVNGLNGATETRASVLQKVVDGINVIAEGNQQFTTSYGQAFYNSEFNRAFVLLQYFGYMKRDPDDAGYAFWLGKLNQFGGNFVNAEMVLAFISSPEYRARFGQP